MTLFAADPMSRQSFGRRSMSSMFSPCRPSFTCFIWSLICCLHLLMFLIISTGLSLSAASVSFSMFYNLCVGRTFSQAKVHCGELISWFLMYLNLDKKELDKWNLLTNRVNISLALVKKSEINTASFPFLNNTAGVF